MIDTDAYREEFGPGRLGSYKHHDDVRFEKIDGDIKPVRFDDFTFPEDADDHNRPETSRALKAARDEGAKAMLCWVGVWLGAAGFGGLKGQACALAHALNSIPNATYAELCEKAGVIKQTGHVAKERLEAVLPLLRLNSDAHDEVRIENQQTAMRESWRRRKKNGLDAVNAEAANEVANARSHESAESQTEAV